MEPETKLLDHPFYQAWEDGDVTVAQLADYGAAYQTFMDRVPGYWEYVLEHLEVTDAEGAEIVAEERDHAELWGEWTAHVPEPDDAPELTALFESLNGMSPSELAGALHAYEVQQPGVAETKKAGLVEHFDLPAADLGFFDEHMDEADHIAFGEYVREAYADEAAFDRGFELGAARVYHSLDAFTAS